MQAPPGPPPMFILSCARSGSTLLRFAFDSHPQVCSPPELHLLQLVQKMVWTCRCLVPEASGTDDAAAWSAATHQARSEIDRLMRDYCRRKGKDGWCEKSISSVNHLDLLDGVFPDARCILLFRHARDVVASGLKATAERSDGFDFEPYLMACPHNRREALLRYWLDKSQLLLQRPDQSLRLRYEDLVREPDRELNRLARGLQLEIVDDWSDRIFTQDHDPGPGDPSIWQRDRVETGSVDRGRELNLAGVPRNLVRRANRLLEQLDYEPLD